MNRQYQFCDPVPEKYELAPAMISLLVKSNSDNLFGRINLPYRNNGDRLPVVLLCHGIPGHEQNGDLEKALCHMGIATCVFHYRGCWGSHGYYRLGNLIEDVHAMLDYLYAHSHEYGIDENRVYLFGHSMGGFAVMNALATGAKVAGAIVFAPANPAHFDRTLLDAPSRTAFLNLESADALNDELVMNREKWSFLNIAEKIPNIPLLFIGGLKDDIVPPDKHVEPVAKKLIQMGYDAKYITFNDSHNVPGSRISFIRTVADWLADYCQV